MLEVLVFILGTCIGSFLNVCIYRIPRGQSIAFPGSKCPSCETKLGVFDLIPLLSFLLLKAKCRHCSAPLSYRYFLVELLTGIIFVSLYLRFGFFWQTVVYWILTSILIAASFIDYEFHIIPNGLVLSGFAVVLATKIAGYNIPLMDGVYGLAVGAGFLGIVALASLLILKKEGMGGGDIKLMAMVGLFIGWRATILALMLAVLSAALVSLLLMVFKLLKREDHIPFGPFLAIGSIVAILYGNEVINWYVMVFWTL
jgi:leader peptidase (prepilin peptidase)/N-methyltransferase